MEENNPQAFACVSGTSQQEGAYLQRGMTLRDYFAAKAMQGLIANPRDYSSIKDHESASKMAYEIADAMLNERLKTK